ncbi:hypothetical protein [Streptomyces flaveolus]|uniref:hypothetical protein n=1 Tax=Streptomyces flaveolus TaxID=67297 RepID=UPI0033DB183C
MADEQDGWLDRETAEILLRGESLEAVDPAVRDRAGRLAEALDALAAYPAPTRGELPGEAAALAAFRKARAADAAEWAGAPAALGHGTAARPSDAGLVRIGPHRDGARRARWGRPLRLGLAAALTAGMVGGVAVAAGTGVLPTPFGGSGPDPAATVSAAATPGRPLGSPTPLDGLRGGSPPDGATPGPAGSGNTRDEAGGGTAGDRGPDAGDGASDGADGHRRELATSCRDVSAGKALDGARRRALTEAAGGTARVGAYCQSVLAGAGTGATTRGRTGGGAGEAAEGALGGAASVGEPRKGTAGTNDGDGKNGKNGKGDKSDKSDKSGKSGQGEKGDNGKQGGGKQSDDGGDEGDDGPHIAPRAHGAPALRPAHAVGAPAALLPLPDLRPTYAPQELPLLGNTA